jgi:glycerate kinase
MTGAVENSKQSFSPIAPGSRILVAMDKFRGTASALELCEVVSDVVRQLDCEPDSQPMSDGGEGFREAFTGETFLVEVPGPLGEVERAGVTLVTGAAGPVAIIECADAVGRQYLPSPSGDQALAASSAGVGELILAAANLGATSVLIGLGGSATSDGGLGCYEVLRDHGGLPVPVIAATDVTARFSGARRYAHQKGVREEDLGLIDERLEEVRALYLREQGVDVQSLERSGAAGGIPGALAALGASLVDGLEAVANAAALASRIAAASMVVTGEGRFDEGSLEGKVTGGLAAMIDGRVPLLILCGSVEPHAAQQLLARFDNLRFLDLSERVGVHAATSNVFGSILATLLEELRGTVTSRQRRKP